MTEDKTRPEMILWENKAGGRHRGFGGHQDVGREGDGYFTFTF